VLLRARGHVTRSAMTRSLSEFQALLVKLERPHWIIDVSQLDNFEPSAVGVGADYFRLFKQAGATKVVLVSGLATARLAAFTIAFAAHVPLMTAESLADACQILNVDAPPSANWRQRRG